MTDSNRDSTSPETAPVPLLSILLGFVVFFVASLLLQMVGVDMLLATLFGGGVSVGLGMVLNYFVRTSSSLS